MDDRLTTKLSAENLDFIISCIRAKYALDYFNTEMAEMVEEIQKAIDEVYSAEYSTEEVRKEVRNAVQTITKVVHNYFNIRDR